MKRLAARPQISWSTLSCILATLLAGVLLVDYLGVRVLDDGGLGFRIHCYSAGLTFWMATLTLLWFFRGHAKLPWVKSLGFAVLGGGAWWFVTFGVLFDFHGSIGGTY